MKKILCMNGIRSTPLEVWGTNILGIGTGNGKRALQIQHVQNYLKQIGKDMYEFQ